jgi:hypothetical protein
MTKKHNQKSSNFVLQLKFRSSTQILSSKAELDVERVAALGAVNSVVVEESKSTNGLRTTFQLDQATGAFLAFFFAKNNSLFDLKNFFSLVSENHFQPFLGQVHWCVEKVDGGALLLLPVFLGGVRVCESVEFAVHEVFVPWRFVQKCINVTLWLSNELTFVTWPDG